MADAAYIQELENALENLAGDVYLYSLAGRGPEGREIAWSEVLKTQGEALRVLRRHTESPAPRG